MDGAVVFNVSANTAKYRSEMGQLPNVASKAASGVERAFSGLGSLLAGGAVVAGLQGILDKFGRIQDLAERFGTSAESIQRVGNAAKLSGADMEMVARVMTKMGVSASAAASKGGEMGEKFAKAGINAREFADAELDQKLVLVAQALQAAAGSADKTNAVLALLGTRGADLVPLLGNVETLKKLLEETATVSNKSVADIARADDALVSLKNNLLVAFIGGSLTAKDAAVSAADGTLNWRQAITTLTSAFADNVAALGPQGAAIAAVTAAINEAGRAAQEASNKTEQATQQAESRVTQALRTTELTLKDGVKAWGDKARAALDSAQQTAKAADKEREAIEKLNDAYNDAQRTKQQDFAARDRELKIRELELSGSAADQAAAAAMRASDAADAAGYGGMDELSQRQREKFIAQEIAKATQSSGGGGGSVAPAALPSAFMTGADLRAEFEKSQAWARAQQQIADGDFGSAGRTISAANARAASRMASAASMDKALSHYGSREQLNKSLAEYNASLPLSERLSASEFAKGMFEDMSKTEAQRKAEEAAGKSGKAKESKPSDPLADIKADVANIWNHIKTSLPQHALS